MHAEGGEIEQVIRLIEERFEEREGEKEELRQLWSLIENYERLETQ